MIQLRTSETSSRKRLAALVTAFVLLFGGLSLWVILSMSREAAQKADTTPVVPENGPSFSAADARTLLLITEDEGQAQGFVLIRFDPAAAYLRTLALPRETVVGNRRLFELYQTQKGAGMGAHITRLTGFSLDYYAVVTYDGLEELLNQTPHGLAFTLPENLRYDMGAYTIHIDGGEQRLSATQMTDVLRYPAWNGGRLQRSAIQAQIISAFINQYFMADAMDSDAGYESCLAIANTNVLREAYYASREALRYVAAKNDGHICQSLSVTGSYTGSGDAVCFHLDTDMRPALRTVFGATG